MIQPGNSPQRWPIGTSLNVSSIEDKTFGRNLAVNPSATNMLSSRNNRFVKKIEVCRRDAIFSNLPPCFPELQVYRAFIPDSIQRAYAIAPEPGSTFLDAEHIVILMQENRSFDHMLGTLRGVRGFNDPRAIRLPNGNSVFVQTDASGASYAPWRLDIKDTRITWMGSIPHSRQSQVDAWNEGRHDGWIEAKRSGKP